VVVTARAVRRGSLSSALPHVIVLDIMLPDIDGYEVCSRLRTSAYQPHPIIFDPEDERSDKIAGLSWAQTTISPSIRY